MGTVRRLGFAATTAAALLVARGAAWPDIDLHEAAVAFADPVAGATIEACAVSASGDVAIVGRIGAGARADDPFVAYYAGGVSSDPTWTRSAPLGGSDDDRAHCVAFGPDGRLYVGGTTASGDVPATIGVLVGSYDGFVAVLDAATAEVESLRLLGGTGEDAVHGIGVDASGRIHLAGRAGRGAGTDFRVGDWGPLAPRGDFDAFYARIGADGRAETLRLLGGDGDDRATSLACSADGVAVLGGITTSATLPGAQATSFGGNVDGFVAVFDDDVRWIRHVGGPGYDYVRGVTVAGDGVATCGATDSAGLATEGTFQPLFRGASGFLARIDADGATEWTTYGGSAGGFLGVAALADDLVVAGDGPGSPFGGGGRSVLRFAPDGTTVLYAGTLAASSAGPMTIAAGTGGDVSLTLPSAAATLVPRAGAAAATALRAEVLPPPVGGHPPVALAWTRSPSAAAQSVRRGAVGAVASTGTNVGASAVTHTDTAAPAGLLFDYWVETTDANGRRTWSNGARNVPPVVDPPEPPPPPPPAPEDVVAFRIGARALVAWDDPSGGVASFEIDRALGGGEFARVGTSPRGVETFFAGLAGAPGDEVRFRVRAVVDGRASDWAGPVSVFVLDTFDLRLARGRIALADGEAADRVELRGRVLFADDRRGFDPAQEALTLLVTADDGDAAPIVLPAGDLGWRARGGRLVWDSDRSAFRGFRGRIEIDLRRGTLDARLAGLDVADLPVPERRRGFLAVRLVLGDDQGLAFDLWTVRSRRPGLPAVWALR